MTTENRFAEVDQLAEGTSSNKIIEIKSLFKTGRHTIQPAFDPKTGWYAGVDRLSDEEKKTRRYYVTVGKTGEEAKENTRIKLEDGYVFDLNNEVDAINWKWVRHCPKLAMSFAEAQKSKVEFYVHIEGREAEVSNEKTEKVFEAMKLVMEDATTNYANRALLLDMDMTGEPDSVIKEYLLTVAKKTPAKIIRIYRDKSMKINLLFVKAKQSGAITVNSLDGVVKFGAHILGYSDESAIAYLQSNEDLLELLERDVSPEYFEAKQSKAKMTPAERAAKAREAKEKK